MNVEWVYRLGSHSGINSASILYDQSQIAHQMDILIWIALDRNEVRRFPAFRSPPFLSPHRLALLEVAEMIASIPDIPSSQSSSSSRITAVVPTAGSEAKPFVPTQIRTFCSMAIRTMERCSSTVCSSYDSVEQRAGTK